MKLLANYLHVDKFVEYVTDQVKMMSLSTNRATTCFSHVLHSLHDIYTVESILQSHMRRSRYGWQQERL